MSLSSSFILTFSHCSFGIPDEAYRPAGSPLFPTPGSHQSPHSELRVYIHHRGRLLRRKHVGVRVSLFLRTSIVTGIADRNYNFYKLSIVILLLHTMQVLTSRA